MKGYVIYLTRSAEVAGMIAKQKAREMGDSEIITGVRHGCAASCELLPEHLQTMEYEFVAVTKEGLEGPLYRIEFA